MEYSRKIKDAIARKYPAVMLEDTLEDAINEMARSNISALVVYNGSELVGLVTIADILFSLTSGSDLQATRISSFMTTCDIISGKETRNPCVQLDEDQDIGSAIKVMYESGVNHLMVSGREGQPVGIVTSLELLKLLAS